MTPPRTLNLSHLSAYSISNKSPLWWGQLMMCLIEASLLLMMVAMYFYLRLSVDVWPPPGTQLPHLLWPTVALIPLILSVWGSYLASEAAKKDDRAGMLRGMILNIALAVAFLVFRFLEIRIFNFTWATDVHGSIVWSVLFLHTVDTIGDMLYTIMLIAIIASGRYGEKQRLGVHADSVVWYFIVAIWVLLYVVIYWGPHIVGAPK